MRMYFDTFDYFHLKVIKEWRLKIAAYEGQEVLIGGLVDEEGKVYKTEVLSRGNEVATPVVYEQARKYDVVIHNHPSGVLKPSNADLNVAAILGDHGVGFYIVDNEYRQVNIVIPTSKKEKKTLIEKDILAFFSLQKEQKEKLEERQSQKKMVQGIIQALNQDKIYVCEAPTGTGKSLAYLVPAFHWIKENKEKVVVSTNTINLQEQLIQKDIPEVEKKLGFSVTYTLVKGRGNYLCRRKFAHFKSYQIENFSELVESKYSEQQVDELIEWGNKTLTGDKSELSFIPNSSLWDQLASEVDTCRRSKCPAIEHCFYQKARRKIFSADLIIVNHHMLCADVALKRDVGKYDTQVLLPAYNRLIIDEAHNIEEVATSYFSQSASRFAIDRNLNLMAKTNKTKEELIGGVVFAIYQQNLKNPQLKKLIKEFPGVIKKLQKQLNHIFEEIFVYLEKIAHSEFQEKKIRFKTSFLKNDQWIKGFKQPIDNLILRLEEIKKKIKDVEKLFNPKPKSIDKQLEQSLHELSVYRNRIENILEVCQESLKLNGKGKIHWVNVSKNKWNKIHFSTNVSPLYVSNELYEALFKPVSTVILTSATLTDSQGFDFFLHSVGLNQINNEKRIVESLPYNFNYKKNCTFMVPRDFPLPHFSTFNEAVADFIKKITIFSEGKTLVLFTSYSQLLNVTRRIRDDLENKNYTLLVQGDAPRTQLIEQFKTRPKHILCGVNSFWEGIDIKGDALTSLVMVKIPFVVPTEPIHEARIEELDKQGQNSFVEYMIPQAVIRFKQGFGRLIRGKKDKGVFIVLDRRILVKPYGQFFIESLPEMETSTHLEELNI